MSAPLDDDAAEEVIAVIQNHLPDYLARDERKRLAEHLLFAFEEEGIYVAPTWFLRDSSQTSTPVDAQPHPSRVAVSAPSLPDDGGRP